MARCHSAVEALAWIGDRTAELRASGAEPSEIADGSPGPREEMRVDDPDGYCLMSAQRGTARSAARRCPN